MEVKCLGRFSMAVTLVFYCLLASLAVASSDVNLDFVHSRGTSVHEEDIESNYFTNFVHFLWQADGSSYKPVWPALEFGWQIVVGSMVGFFGAAFGSVGGVGGGGIFVPMLTLIVGFDPKSATAISKCMIMGAAGSTVYYNLKLRHPTMDIPIIDYDLAVLIQPMLMLGISIGMIMGAAGSTVYYNLKLRHPTMDIPIIDYDLAVLIQPMLMLGISIGVIFNVIFPDWMVTVLLIVLFIGTSTKAFIKGVDTWKRETVLKKEAAKFLVNHGEGSNDVEYRSLPMNPNSEQKGVQVIEDPEVPILQNVYWKELGLLVFVWMAFLALQITKNYTATCSTWYWILNFLQAPVSVAVTLYEAISLYKGERVIASRGDEWTSLKVSQLFLYCLSGIVAGIVGGLLGLGGGFILGPLFLELGIPPQVSSATATFAMTFSSSMSVVEYYLLNRFPVPYAVYFASVATIAAFVGQHVVRRLVILMGRASLIIFILASMIFISAISLGGFGIANMIKKFENNEYMGFENLCRYQV